MGLFSASDADIVEAFAASPGLSSISTLINGQQNPVTVTVRNKAQHDVELVSVGASFHDPSRHWKLLRNATIQRYASTRIPASSNLSFPYSFYSEFPPTSLGLTIFVNLQSPSSSLDFRLTAFNATTFPVSPPIYPLTDPGLWLAYAIIAAVMTFVTWSSWRPLVRNWRGKDKAMTKKGSKWEKKVKVVVPAKLTGDYPENVKPYDEEWIPTSQLKSRLPRTAVVKGASIVSDPDIVSGGDEGSANTRRR